MSKKIVVALGLMTALSATGCTLYFGEADDGWSDDGGGWYCTSDNQCASGCYCSDDGVCEEAGFCSSDGECPPGFLCDEGRNSCDPDGTSEGCASDADCPFGSYCDELSGVCIGSWTCDPTNPSSCGTGYICTAEGTCVPIGCNGDDANCAAGCYCDDSNNCAESCYCTSDTDATTQGWGYCDESRSTCMPGTDPNAPVCGNGVVDAGEACDDGNTVDTDGCSNACTVTACEAITTQAACSARPDCENVYRGLNCTDPNGLECTEGAAMCTCETFVWDECRTSTLP
jgi:cysteine-rich repeat protein